MSGAGRDTYEATNYQFLDTKAGETNYYRLKSVDKDASYKYSSIVQANTTCELGAGTVEIYPNPVGTEYPAINIRFLSNTNNARFSVTDLFGKRLRTVDVDANEGWNTISIDIANLPAGIYFVIDENSKELNGYKFVKLNE